MKIMVTGAAGFIGSHLCEQLLETGKHEVVGIDGLINPNLIKTKERNLAVLRTNPRFSFYPVEIERADLDELLKGIDIVCHLAGLPGVRTSWGENFQEYIRHNVLATQSLLEAVRKFPVKRFIYASTSSVYGERKGELNEGDLPHPLSPYGVSKLAAEHLCHVYYKNYGVPVVILRYFTVYGPRQREDMAFYRIISGIINQTPVIIYGDGMQTRDFTYISDCVAGTIAAMEAPGVIGETINLGGGETSTLLNVVSHIEEITGKKAMLTFFQPAKGEPRHTKADISKAKRLLNYHPATTIRKGLENQVIDYLTSQFNFQ